MLYADAHCDTIMKILDENQSLIKNNCHLDLSRMRDIGLFLQFFAAWTDGGFRRADAIIDKFYAEQGNVCLVKRAEDIDYTKTCAVLTIEDGQALEGDISKLEYFYERGVRSMTLTWNGENELGYGAVDSAAEGLKPFGREVVKRMNQLGMMIDVSHLSERGFWDVLNVSTAPIMATHSNARAIHDHPRNLTDEQIKAIVESGGFIGINFYSGFLAVDAKVDDINRHIDHLVELGAEYSLGLGGDLDGVDELPEGFAGVQDYNKIEVNGDIAYKNLVNYIKKVCI